VLNRVGLMRLVFFASSGVAALVARVAKNGLIGPP
jgi:hypothetical protein